MNAQCSALTGVIDNRLPRLSTSISANSGVSRNSGRPIRRVLRRACTSSSSQRGAPAYLRCDNGPEFVARAVLKWIVDQGIGAAFIDPGKPWQNGSDESFNGKFRGASMSMEYFRNRTEARVVIEQWRCHYNAVRPHSALGYLTPAQFVRNLSGDNHEAPLLK